MFTINEIIDKLTWYIDACHFTPMINEGEIRDIHLRDDLIMDDIDIVEFIMWIEDEFDISIKDNDIESLVTVGSVIDYIHGRFTGGK